MVGAILGSPAHIHYRRIAAATAVGTLCLCTVLGLLIVYLINPEYFYDMDPLLASVDMSYLTDSGTTVLLADEAYDYYLNAQKEAIKHPIQVVLMVTYMLLIVYAIGVDVVTIASGLKANAEMRKAKGAWSPSDVSIPPPSSSSTLVQ